MEVALLAWSLLGALLGLTTGLVPGLHVNTLAAVGLALRPGGGPEAAVLLVAVGVAHTFVTVLPSTYLGVPGDDAPHAVLPAHRLLREGRAPAAVHASVHASLLGLVGAVALVLPLRWVLGEPVRLLEHLDAAAPWLLAGTLALLLWQDRHRLPASIATMALAGWLGLQAFRWPVAGLLPLPATPLLPLLGGLYGVPGLVHALRTDARTPLQDDAPPWSHRPATRRRDVLPGLLVSAATAVLPGLTSAVATSIARAGRRDTEPLPVLATLSVVNTAHAVLALTMLWLVGRPRSGLAQAVDALAPVVPWNPGPPSLLVALLQACLVAGVVGAAGTLWLERPVRLGLERLPRRAPSLVGLGAVLLLTVVLTGPRGFLLLAVAAVVGSVPLALGTRRTHLAAALLVPILWRLTR